MPLHELANRVRPKPCGSKLLTKISPSFAICGFHLDNGAEELQRLVKLIASLQQHPYGVHGLRRVRIRLKSALVGVHRLVGNAQQFREAA